MTSQSSTSSLAKHRQSWLDLVSQASPPAGETAVVGSVQVHSTYRPETDEADGAQALESLPQWETDGTESNKENPAVDEEEVQRIASDAQEEGETLFDYWNYVVV